MDYLYLVFLIGAVYWVIYMIYWTGGHPRRH
jgi:hypothetical protein